MLIRTATKVEDAAALIPDGASVMVGGFMGIGSPHRLIDALVAHGTKDLTIIANDTAYPGFGIAKLVTARAIKRLITSHIGLNPETQQQMNAGEMQVDLIPQGTLVERIRAGGVGLGGFLTPTGVGTEVEEGKQKITLNDKEYLLEEPLKADFALIAAKQSDYVGNLEYAMTAQNFNPSMAMAAETVIAEPVMIVPVGAIPPDAVRTPGSLVDHIIERAH